MKKSFSFAAVGILYTDVGKYKNKNQQYLVIEGSDYDLTQHGSYRVLETLFNAVAYFVENVTEDEFLVTPIEDEESFYDHVSENPDSNILISDLILIDDEAYVYINMKPICKNLNANANSFIVNTISRYDKVL